MRGDTALVRCRKCGVINRVPVDKIALGPICGKCKSFLDIPRRPVPVSSANFDREVLDWPGLVLVDFWAPWCAHCAGMDIALDELAGQRTGRLKIVKVNAQTDPDLVSKFDIRGIPTLMLFENGTRLDEMPGALQKQQIEEWVDSLSGRHS